jgi:NitT/TauT family transport system substrate-binding protein
MQAKLRGGINMTKRSIFSWVVLSSAVMAGTMMFNASPAQAGDAVPISTETVTINLGYPLLAPTWGSTIITAAKLWKKYLPNVEVNRVDFMSSMPVVNNMVAGKIDIGYFADMPAIVLASQANLTPTMFVSLTDTDEGGASVVYVKKNSAITTVKELNGKRVSVPFGGYTHRFAEVVESVEQVKFDLVGQSPEVGLTSMQAGTVDAYIPWPPYGPLAVYRGFAQKLVDGTKYKFNAIRGAVVTRAFAERYPKILIGWLRAELDAHKILREHQNYAAQLIFDDWKKYDIPLDVIKQDFAYKFFPDAITSEWRKVLVDGAAFLQSHKFIEHAVDLDTFINDSYLQQAAAIPSQLDESAIPK